MARRLGMVMAGAAGLILAGSSARAFTLGETVAATGVHQTMAKSGTTSAARTIGSVKGALQKAVATKEGQLKAAGGPVGWGGKPGGSGWLPGGASGAWAVGGTSGWAMASAAGWAPGGASGAWASGSWSGSR